MTGTTSALAFLLARTVRNRFVRQLARVRQPRYAIAVVLGLGYLWLVFLRPFGSADTPQPGVPDSGSSAMATLAVLGLAITVFLWWLKGGVSGSLAFQPAEVHYLFTAPLSRRTLIIYRIIRSQVVILINSLLWLVLIRRWGIEIPWPLRFLTTWGFITFISLHRLAVALVQTAPVTGSRRAGLLAGRAVSVLGLVALAWALVPILLRFNALGAPEAFRAAGEALTLAPAAWALAPFGAMLAPLQAGSIPAWASAFAIVLLVVVLHLVVVLGMRVSFEETAASASAELARKVAAMRDRRAGGGGVIGTVKVSRFRLPLRPTGWKGAAIVWKNTVALSRMGSLRFTLFIIALMVIGSRLIASLDGERETGAAAAPFFALAVMSFILGPRMVRNDLRQDLLSLSLLKTYPLRGMQIVAAELVSPTVVLALFQLLMVVAGWLSMTEGARAQLANASGRSLMVVVPFAMVALNAASVAIQNGIALAFPAWVRLGHDSGGIEAIGQNILVMIGGLLALAATLVLPLFGGYVARVLSAGTLGAGAVTLAVTVGTVLLAAEVLGLLALLGAALERTEPSALA